MVGDGFDHSGTGEAALQNSAGTMDCDYVFDTIVNAGYDNIIDNGDRDERRRYIRQSYLRLLQKLGAVLGGAYGNQRLLYWPAKRQSLPKRTIDRRPLVVLAGYMSEARGIHWKRKRI